MEEPSNSAPRYDLTSSLPIYLVVKVCNTYASKINTIMGDPFTSLATLDKGSDTQYVKNTKVSIVQLENMAG